METGGKDRRAAAAGALPAGLLARARPLADGLAAPVLPAGRGTLRLRLEDAGARLADTVRHELDAGLALPGLVVVFALGIVFYFLLPREPWPPAVFALALVASGAVAWRRRNGHAARLGAIVAALAVGVAAGSLATWRVAAPRLDHERTVTVEGRVVELDGTERGGVRMTVDVVRMEGRGLTAETTPRRITATLSARVGRPEVGAGIRFLARLKPPEGPVLPGGYDFARRAWFEGRGAGGYVLGRWTAIDLGPPMLSARLAAPIGGLRHVIAERVRASLPGATGAIAAALMVGEQRAIPESVAEPLRASGLTHIVSISGLHMALVAGGVLVMVRGLLALFPALALGFAIKKWAAVAAFAAATGYLLLAGDQVAALRSHLMLSVALFAVMVDRPAITMHTIAVSAALILAVEPWSVMEPSFQMSYLAVIALVASYDLYRAFQARRPPPAREAPLAVHLIGAGFRQIEGFAFSSLVAGLATAPVILGVFHRAATYSILANMAVLPVTGLVIMPAAVVAAVAMPFGLDQWPLVVMGIGIDWMIVVGKWAAALPAGGGLVGAPHAATMPLGILAVLWLSAWRGGIRLFGLLPAVAAIALVFAGSRPDLIVGRHGEAVAVRGGDGRLHVLASRQERFDVAIWLAADGDGRAVTDPGLGEGWRCDPIGCVFREARPAATEPGRVIEPESEAARDPADAGEEPVRTSTDDHPSPARSPQDGEAVAIEVAIVRHPRGFEEECGRAAVIVTTLVAPPGCRDVSTVIDRLDLARGGATTLTFHGPPRPMGARGDPRGEPSDGSAGRWTIDPTHDPTLEPTPAPAAVREPDGAGLGSFGPAARLPAEDRMGDRSEAATAATRGPATGPTAPPEVVRGRPPDAADISVPPEGALRTDPPTQTRDTRRVTALPVHPRPWTPIDPQADRLELDARRAETAAVAHRRSEGAASGIALPNRVSVPDTSPPEPGDDNAPP